MLFHFISFFRTTSATSWMKSTQSWKRPSLFKQNLTHGLEIGLEAREEPPQKRQAQKLEQWDNPNTSQLKRSFNTRNSIFSHEIGRKMVLFCAPTPPSLATTYSTLLQQRIWRTVDGLLILRWQVSMQRAGPILLTSKHSTRLALVNLRRSGTLT